MRGTQPPYNLRAAFAALRAEEPSDDSLDEPEDLLSRAEVVHAWRSREPERTCAVCCDTLRAIADSGSAMDGGNGVAAGRGSEVSGGLVCNVCHRANGITHDGMTLLVCSDFDVATKRGSAGGANGGSRGRCTYVVCRSCSALPHSERGPRRRAGAGSAVSHSLAAKPLPCVETVRIGLAPPMGW